MPPIVTLSEDDYQNIVTNLGLLEEAEIELNRAEIAGVDIASRKTKLQQERQQLLRLKQAYFPGR